MISKLVHHYEERLGAPDGALIDRAGHFIVSQLRDQPDESGCCLPFWAFSIENSFVVSSSPAVANILPLNLSNFTFESLREEELRAELRHLIEGVIRLRALQDEWELYCSPETFQPVVSPHVRPVTLQGLTQIGKPGILMRRMLEDTIEKGDAFGFFQESRLVTLAWLKRYSKYAWNIFLYPREGAPNSSFSEACVSSCVSRALEFDKAPVMNVPAGNASLLRMADSLGFKVFGESLLAISKQLNGG